MLLPARCQELQEAGSIRYCTFRETGTILVMLPLYEKKLTMQFDVYVVRSRLQYFGRKFVAFDCRVTLMYSRDTLPYSSDSSGACPRVRDKKTARFRCKHVEQDTTSTLVVSVLYIG